MSRFLNLTSAFVPVREAREVSGTLAALNAELVLDVNGDENVLLSMVNGASFIGTVTFSGCGDSGGTNYHALPAYPFAVGNVGGTIPIAGEPMLANAIVAANTLRQWSIPCQGLKKVRVVATAYTSGSAAFTMRSDTQSALNTAIIAKPATLLVTATAAAGTGVTATLPAVAGLRHVVDFIRVTRSATAALTAAAVPVLVTTTNIPGSPVLTFGSDVAGVGLDKFDELQFGGSGMACTALGTATTIICPAYTGVIWRVNVAYRLGL